MNISEKAALYADGKARKACASAIKAIAQAYEDGYKDGYKERQTGAPLNSGVVEFVDFGLSSGTLWTIDFETDANGNIIYLP